MSGEGKVVSGEFLHAAICADLRDGRVRVARVVSRTADEIWGRTTPVFGFKEFGSSSYERWKEFVAVLYRDNPQEAARKFSEGGRNAQ